MNNWKTTVLGLAAMAVVGLVVYRDPALINSDGVKLLILASFGAAAGLLYARDRKK